MVTRSGAPSGGSSTRSSDDEIRSRVRLGLLDAHKGILAERGGWIDEHAPDFELAVSASSWLELITSEAFPTQVVIMKLELDEPISLEARVRTCRAAGAAVIVLSSSEDRAIHQRVLQAGAVRHFCASRPTRVLLEETRAALEMRSADVAAAQWRPLPSGVAGIRRPRLSAGELEALRLYASGSSTPEVAASMNVRFETAKTYLRRVRRKYREVGRSASRRIDLIRRAGEDGFLE